MSKKIPDSTDMLKLTDKVEELVTEPEKGDYKRNSYLYTSSIKANW